MSKRTFNLPTQSVFCNTPDNPSQFIQDSITSAIKYLKSIGVPIYEDTTVYDPEFPRLVFSFKENVSQSSLSFSNSADVFRIREIYPIVVNSVEEFVALFEVERLQPVTVCNITKEYDAVVSEEGIKVG
jgi:hypothetical protein